MPGTSSPVGVVVEWAERVNSRLRVWLSVPVWHAAPAAAKKNQG
jgi:hypothetical protein